MEKNQSLDSLSQRHGNETSQDEDIDEEDPVADLIDDIMLLNEEVESQDSHVTTLRRHLHSLASVMQSAHREELGEIDEHEAATGLALELVKHYSQLKSLEAKLMQQLESIGEQTSRDPLSTPLPYMLQLPPTQVCLNQLGYNSHSLGMPLIGFPVSLEYYGGERETAMASHTARQTHSKD